MRARPKTSKICHKTPTFLIKEPNERSQKVSSPLIRSPSVGLWVEQREVSVIIGHSPRTSNCSGIANSITVHHWMHEEQAFGDCVNDRGVVLHAQH